MCSKQITPQSCALFLKKRANDGRNRGWDRAINGSLIDWANVGVNQSSKKENVPDLTLFCKIYVYYKDLYIYVIKKI